MRKIKSHLDIVSEYIPEETDQIYIEGQFRGKAMIGLDYFMRGYFSVKYPLARIGTLSARSWKSILGPVRVGKNYYENEIWEEEINQDDIIDLCEGDLLKRKHDVVDVHCMMKYVLKKGF